jgi:hypothetical protein
MWIPEAFSRSSRKKNQAVDRPDGIDAARIAAGRWDLVENEAFFNSFHHWRIGIQAHAFIFLCIR